MKTDLDLPTYADVLKAAEVLKGVAHKTPVMTSRRLNKEVGGEVFFKCENFQRIGAFKFRGAYNAVYNLTDEEKKVGIVAQSSGNHAQALSLASSILGVKANLLMPNDAPELKVQAT